MNAHKIDNISFVLGETAIEFSFTRSYAKNDCGFASLQLPDVGDSEHLIDDEDYDYNNESHEAIFNQLSKFYFASFKDADCAAASSLLEDLITHVEEVDGLYVAFGQHSTYLIKENAARSYYGVSSLFDVLNDSDLLNSDDESLDVDSVIERGKRAYFESLARIS